MLVVTDKMRERIDAGVAWVYKTRDGHVWHIDSMLPIPCRNIDFSETSYCAYDGTNFYAQYPSLSMCQFALEEGCPEWHGVGWYEFFPPQGSGLENEVLWFDFIEGLKDELSSRRRMHGEGYSALHGGSGAECATYC